MSYRFYVHKIIQTLLLIIVFIQCGAFLLLKMNNELIAENTVIEELRTGKQVFTKILELRAQQIDLSTSILANDFGFKTAINSEDDLTIASALLNHQQRANASLLILSDKDKHFINSSRAGLNKTLQKIDLSQLDEAINASNKKPFFIRLANHDQKNANTSLYQMFSKPINAPIPMAKLFIGYEINKQFALELKEATDLDFIFYCKNRDKWHLETSSLTSEIDSQLLPNKTITEFTDKSGVKYLALPVEVNDFGSNEVIIFIAKPLNKMLEPFQKLEKIMLYSLIISMILSLIGIYFVATKMVGKISDLAHSDSLTALGNRRYFNMIIETLIKDKNQKSFALFILDLNKFKTINDTFGHDVGDAVLTITAKRLKAVLRDSDYIFRLGGDEFAIIVMNNNKADLKKIATKIKALVATPIMHNQNRMKTSISIGIARYPNDANTQLALFKLADNAAYTAKLNSLKYQFCDET